MRLKTQGRGVEGTRNDPERFGAAGGRVDAFGVAAGEGVIGRIADEQDGKRASGYGSFGRDAVRGKTSQRLTAINENPGEWREKCFAKQRRLAQAGVVVARFHEIGERSFRDDGFDAGIGACGLQGDAGAHGFAKSKNVRGVFGGDERVDDGGSVGAFEPAVSGDGAFALAVGAGVHHGDAVSGAQ